MVHTIVVYCTPDLEGISINLLPGSLLSSLLQTNKWPYTPYYIQFIRLYVEQFYIFTVGYYECNLSGFSSKTPHTIAVYTISCMYQVMYLAPCQYTFSHTFTCYIIGMAHWTAYSHFLRQTTDCHTQHDKTWKWHNAIMLVGLQNELSLPRCNQHFCTKAITTMLRMTGISTPISLDPSIRINRFIHISSNDTII